MHAALHVTAHWDTLLMELCSAQAGTKYMVSHANDYVRTGSTIPDPVSLEYQSIQQANAACMQVPYPCFLKAHSKRQLVSEQQSCALRACVCGGGWMGGGWDYLHLQAM